MDLALDEARAAAKRGEVPVGAVVLDEKRQVIARAGNRTRELDDPTAHAEMLAIRAAASALGRERLTGCALYVTLEPKTNPAANCHIAQMPYCPVFEENACEGHCFQHFHLLELLQGEHQEQVMLLLLHQPQLRFLVGN